MKQPNTKATWNASLNCYCPSCDEYVDLLDYADFWDGRNLEIDRKSVV